MYKYTIDNKPLLTKENGDEVRDLTVGVFDMVNAVIADYKMYRVPSSMVMRPDLLSNSAYGSTDYTEMVLKYNGISNPFSIDVDDFIIIPNKTSILNIVSNTTEVEDNLLVSKSYKYIDPTKFPKGGNDSTISSFDDRDINGSSNNNNILPPNISDIGEEQITHRNGRVYFGENIGKSCLYDGMSSGEYLQTIVKNNKL